MKDEKSILAVSIPVSIVLSIIVMYLGSAFILNDVFFNPMEWKQYKRAMFLFISLLIFLSIFLAILKFNENIMQKKTLFVSAKDLQNHVSGLGISGSNKSKIEAKLKEASKEHGMILVVKTNILPSGAMHEEVDLKGRVLIASQITDNTKIIEQQLIDLNMIDEFDDSESKKIIELATDLLSHHGNLDIK